MARQEPVENEDFRAAAAPGVVLAGCQQNSALGFMKRPPFKWKREILLTVWEIIWVTAFWYTLEKLLPYLYL